MFQRCHHIVGAELAQGVGAAIRQTLPDPARFRQRHLTLMVCLLQVRLDLPTATAKDELGAGAGAQIEFGDGARGQFGGTAQERSESQTVQSR